MEQFKLRLFLCGCSCPISNFNNNRVITKSIKTLTEIIIAFMKSDLNKFILAVKSNTNNYAVEGYNDQVVINKKGKNSTMNSSIQLTIKIKTKSAKKIYKPKLFISKTNGNIQISGVVCEDLSDGIIIVKQLVKFINYLHSIHEPEIQSEILDFFPTLLNYSTEIKKKPGELVDIIKLRDILAKFKIQNVDPVINEKQELFELSNYNSNEGFIKLTAGINLIREVMLKDFKLSFSFDFGCAVVKKGSIKKKYPKIIIFSSGKINIFNCINFNNKRKIETILNQIFVENWDDIIYIKKSAD